MNIFPCKILVLIIIALLLQKTISKDNRYKDQVFNSSNIEDEVDKKDLKELEGKLKYNLSNFEKRVQDTVYCFNQKEKLFTLTEDLQLFYSKDNGATWHNNSQKFKKLFE